LTFTRPVADWIALARRPPGVRIVSVSAAIAVDSVELPGLEHGDPADRIIAATARARDGTLVTADRTLIAYGQTGRLRVLDLTARRAADAQ
jgi:PIN domain nuclease of toxin-antitoxin system